MNINQKIAEVLDMSDKATIGPWTVDNTKGLIGGDGSEFAMGADSDGTVWFNRQEDADFATNARLDLPALAHAIDAVMELHVSHMDTSYDSLGNLDMYCDHCNVEYPCPTVKALDKGFKRAAAYALMDFDRENGITE